MPFPEEKIRSTNQGPEYALASQISSVISVRYPACASTSSARWTWSLRRKRSRSLVSRQMPVCVFSAYAPPTKGSSPCSWRRRSASRCASCSSCSAALRRSGAICTRARWGWREGRANRLAPGTGQFLRSQSHESVCARNTLPPAGRPDATGRGTPPRLAGRGAPTTSPRRARPPSRLTRRAVVRAPATLHDAFDGRPASAAGLSSAVVHEEDVLSALFDVGDRLLAVLVRQRRAQRRADGLGQPLRLLASHRMGQPPRID